MKKLISTILLCCLISSGLQAQEKPARIRLTDVTLMHEMRATPSPSDKATVSDRAISFQWPLRSDINTSEAVLDGMKSNKKKVDKSRLKYRLRYSQDAALKKQRDTGRNPLALLQPGGRPSYRCMVLAIRIRE